MLQRASWGLTLFGLGLIASQFCSAIGVVRLEAQTCTPTAAEDFSDNQQAGYHSADGSKVYLSVVPASEVWLVRAAGVFSEGGAGQNGGYEYMMEVIHPVFSQGFLSSATVEEAACCWRIAVARTPGLANGTPVLALGREIILTVGERLGSRVNSLPQGVRYGLMATYLKYPASCLPSLIIR